MTTKTIAALAILPNTVRLAQGSVTEGTGQNARATVARAFCPPPLFTPAAALAKLTVLAILPATSLLPLVLPGIARAAEVNGQLFDHQPQRAWLENYDPTLVSSRLFSEFSYESHDNDADYYNTMKISPIPASLPLMATRSMQPKSPKAPRHRKNHALCGFFWQFFLGKLSRKAILPS